MDFVSRVPFKSMVVFYFRFIFIIQIFFHRNEALGKKNNFLVFQQQNLQSLSHLDWDRL